MSPRVKKWLPYLVIPFLAVVAGAGHWLGAWDLWDPLTALIWQIIGPAAFLIIVGWLIIRSIRREK